MILCINCIIAEKPREDFEKKTIPYLQEATEKKIHSIHITELKKYEDFRPYSHLLISGSELSASRENEWDAELYYTIRTFIDAKKAVYGICYGHQMIARSLLGLNACQRAKVPEFGWHHLALAQNPIFEEISDFYVVQSHYDEVCNLTKEFTILARTDACEVQAFQYKNLPVWGTQFHPEMDWERGSKMLNSNLETEEAAKIHYRNDVKTPENVAVNIKIFENFFNA